MSKMVIDRCLAISCLGSIYVAVDRPITDYPYARMRLPGLKRNLLQPGA